MTGVPTISSNARSRAAGAGGVAGVTAGVGWVARTV